MDVRSLLVIPIVLTGMSLTVSPGADASDHGSISFHATVSGKVRDSGTVSSGQTVLDSRYPEFNGCAIIKQKHPEILGAYTLEIRINRSAFLLGGWQSGALDLSIDNYRPSVATYMSPAIGGKFAMSGHAYGASVTYSTVTVREGGRSGTYLESRGNRLQPGSGQITPSVSGSRPYGSRCRDQPVSRCAERRCVGAGRGCGPEHTVAGDRRRCPRLLTMRGVISR